MPAFPVPMQDERLARDLAALDNFHAGSPDILCGGGCDRAQDVVLDLRLPHTRAGHNAPDGAIPVLRQRAAVIETHRPHIGWRKGSHRCQHIVDESWVRTAHNRPGATATEGSCPYPAS